MADMLLFYFISFMPDLLKPANQLQKTVSSNSSPRGRSQSSPASTKTKAKSISCLSWLNFCFRSGTLFWLQVYLWLVKPLQLEYCSLFHYSKPTDRKARTAQSTSLKPKFRFCYLLCHLLLPVYLDTCTESSDKKLLWAGEMSLWYKWLLCKLDSPSSISRIQVFPRERQVRVEQGSLIWRPHRVLMD